MLNYRKLLTKTTKFKLIYVKPYLKISLIQLFHLNKVKTQKTYSILQKSMNLLEKLRKSIIR